MNVKDRNNFARMFTEEQLDKAEAASADTFGALHDLDALNDMLTSLIEIKAKGFRGMIATAIVGLEIDPSYDPLNNFYGCNPRSIFEQGIANAFRNRIPSGKSDPLNVAKNVNVLDDGWIKGKRPETAAKAAVDYLGEIVQAPARRKSILIDLFYYRLVKYAHSIAAINITVPN